MLKLRKEVWKTIRDLQDLIYENNITETYHVQNRTLSSLLAKHGSCSDLNVLFKMLLDAQALKYHYEKDIEGLPGKNLKRRRL